MAYTIKHDIDCLYTVLSRFKLLKEDFGNMRDKTSEAVYFIRDGGFNTIMDSYDAKMTALVNKMDQLLFKLGAFSLVLSMFIAKYEEDERKLLTDILQDWAIEQPANGMNYYFDSNGNCSWVCFKNDGGEVSCTYYTLRKLRERGLGFPFKVINDANGGRWFDNSVSNYKFPGKNCLDDLFDQYVSDRKSVNNIVVSFGANASAPYGHVLLIDRMYKDPETGETMVTWSDMDYPFQRFYDVDGKNEPWTKSLSEFKNYYHWSDAVAGAVIVGEP